MKSFLFIAIFLFIGSVSTYPETQQTTGNIVVEISGIEHTAGVMMVALFDEDDKFLKEPSFAKEIPVNEDTTIIVEFDKIPFGVYAISIYHDLNTNGELDSNFIKIPKEPIGFSNNYFPKFGPPKFKNASFNLDQNELKMKVHLDTF